MSGAGRALRAALLAGVAGIGVAAAGAGYLAWRALNAPSEDAASAALANLGTDFALTDQNGATVRLSDLRGKAVLMFFGYTHCPDVCPATLFTMAQARKLMGDDAARFQGVFVTVDPARDTPERLREYVAFFDPSFLALTGTDAEIATAARAFGAAFEKGEPTPDGGYLMGHTTFGYLLGPDGKVRQLFPSNAPPEEVAKAARAALAG